MIVLALMAALAGTAPQKGELKMFGDWIVGCDNGRSCQANLLDSDVAVIVTRPAGAQGAARITLTLEAPANAAYRLKVDDKVMATGRLSGGYSNNTITLSGDVAARILSAMAAGDSMDVETGSSPAAVTSLSLTGSSAALRYIDDRQGRAGGVTALVARGPKPAADVPSPPPLPWVLMAEPPRAGATAFVPTPAEIDRMRKDSQCEAEDTEIESAVLDNLHTLLLLPCGAGAYNASTVPFIAAQTNAGRSITLAKLDDIPATADGPPMLINGGYDPKTRSIDSYGKGRGLGDCGDGARYIWDGTMFRLIEATSMSECRGSTDWITIWRANVRVTR